MQDPFFPPPIALIRASQPLSTALALRTLPLHMHEILPAFSFYQFVNLVLAPRISSHLFPKTYPNLPPSTKLNWNVRVVSTVQSCLISGATLWLIWADNDRRQMDWRQRVWGYSGATGMIQGFSAGYFLWDLYVCARDFESYGVGLAAHAISALAVTMLGFVSSLQLPMNKAIFGPLTKGLSGHLSITTGSTSCCMSSALRF